LADLEGGGDGDQDDDDDGMTVEVEEFGGGDEPTGPPQAVAEADLPDLRPKSNRRRQTFVFSATLGVAVADALAKSSHVRSARTRRGLPPLKAPAQSSGDGLRDAVDAENDARTAQLLEALEFQGAKPPAVVDLTNSSLTVKQLREYRVECTLEAKDVYLYAFLELHRGRTLVFVNAISAIRRLLPLLTLLKVPVWSLHAQKQQRQRLKVLDRFRAATYGVLIATDVAARGLDIPSVDHVVHFQVPRTIELYVHRTGRTARAQREGVSLMIVSPEDRDNFLKLVRLPGKKDKAFTPMVFDPEKMVAIERRVQVARDLEVAQHRRAKREADKRDLAQARAAKEAGAGDDDDVSDNDGTEEMAFALQRRMLKRELQLAERAAAAAAEGEGGAGAGAAAMSKRAKRKAAKRKDAAPHRLVADASGELTAIDRSDPRMVLPDLRRSLKDELAAPLTKRRRAFLAPDADALRLMTGSRPDALATVHDDALGARGAPHGVARGAVVGEEAVLQSGALGRGDCAARRAARRPPAGGGGAARGQEGQVRGDEGEATRQADGRRRLATTTRWTRNETTPFT
jgi:superfamily II DNA/RNA helicase